MLDTHHHFDSFCGSSVATARFPIKKKLYSVMESNLDNSVVWSKSFYDDLRCDISHQLDRSKNIGHPLELLISLRSFGISIYLTDISSGVVVHVQTRALVTP